MTREYPEDWERRRREVYARDDYTCQECGAKGGPRGDAELHAHHIVSKSEGGTHAKQNLITVCRACHDAIHGHPTAPTPSGNAGLIDGIKQAINRHYRTDDHEDGYGRLGKSPNRTGTVQQHVDRGRNSKYGGCPNCGAYSLTVSWVGLHPGAKVKIIECTACSAQYDEQIVKVEGTTKRTLREIDGPSDVNPSVSAVLAELKDQLRLLLNI